MTDEQTPAAGPLTAESVKLLKPCDWLLVLRLCEDGPEAGSPVRVARTDGPRVWISGDGDSWWFDRFTFLGRPDPDGWIAWHGGENPVPGVRVDVRWRNGVVISAPSDDEASIDWTHPFGTAHDDVVAYRPHVASPASSSSVVQGGASGVERESVEDLWRELCERDDRTSPAEYPEMCLIAFDEFSDFIKRAAPVSRPGDGQNPSRDTSALSVSNAVLERVGGSARDKTLQPSSTRPAGEGEREAVARITGDDLHEILASFEDRADVGEIAAKINERLDLLSPAAPDAGGGDDPVQIAVEALKRGIKRCETYEHIRLGGRSEAAKKAGTLRNTLTDMRQALSSLQPGGER